jgi:hypothetical protein
MIDVVFNVAKVSIEIVDLVIALKPDFLIIFQIYYNSREKRKVSLDLEA